MVRGTVFINDVQLLIMESYPIQVMLNISGELPTPCHIFKADVSEPDEDNEIQVEIYSLVAEGEVCIEVIQPFIENVSIPMAGKPDGVYTVWVNEEKVGEFSYPG
jgi:inhibitor of cysteine peptidase